MWLSVGVGESKDTGVYSIGECMHRCIIADICCMHAYHCVAMNAFVYVYGLLAYWKVM